MPNSTLETINESILKLRGEVARLRIIVEEDLDLSDEVIEEIEDSRDRNKDEFVSHEQMKQEFLSDDSD